MRIIPAHAGNIIRYGSTPAQSPAHPRARRTRCPEISAFACQSAKSVGALVRLREKALTVVIQEAYVQRTSMRPVDDLVPVITAAGISQS